MMLEIRGLSAGYGPLRVLHELDLHMDPGERVGLVGLNGHGKTTLMRAVMGLVDWRTGEVEFRGSSISDSAPYLIARMGLMFIPPGDELFPGLTVRENLDAGAFAKTWRKRKGLRSRVIELFPPLARKLDQAVGTLSGGERRMVSLGRGLMADADLYLIDEMSLGLAPRLAIEMVQSLFGGGFDRSKGMLIAEQNRSLLEGKVDRILVMHGGRLYAQDETPPEGLATGLDPEGMKGT